MPFVADTGALPLAGKCNSFGLLRMRSTGNVSFLFFATIATLHDTLRLLARKMPNYDVDSSEQGFHGLALTCGE
ncbi:hypothetical protein FF011L_01320 [Roseimaritima multifibrata]|uniref:Uncharacterized protein n=1 Tax=Roseimaritima multifibrata TaxID=1930274 RepID=A0A517M940_9BACT|nr:hypothetical protein FF011L_01320 [Roseimaritima multifibrata]